VLSDFWEAMGEINAMGRTQLPVVVDSMNLDTYSRFLEVPGLLNVQLKAPDATAEELRQYPARLSKEGKIFTYQLSSA